MVLGFKGASKFKDIYDTDGVTNIRDGLAPAFESRPSPIEPVDVQCVPGNSNLFLMPGHLGLAEYEVTLGIAQELSGSLVTLQNLPGALNYLFELTAKKYNIDIILVDMSPSLGPINQNLLMTSDYFLVPMAPDYFSVMATESLSATLPKWHSWSTKAKQTPALKTASYPYPDKSPKFLGTIIQRFKLRKGDSPSAAFQDWIDDINIGVKDNLIPSLTNCDMMLDNAKYLSAGFHPEEPILQMSDFNGLIAQSQKYQAPVFDLTKEQIEQSGIVLDRIMASMVNFKRLYDEGADRILTIIESE